MELGIGGKTAIICGASKGLGKACAVALAEEGVNIVISARTEETLSNTASEIAQMTSATVTAVASDITTEEGRAALIKACPDPDILVNNAGGPPPGDFRNWSQEDWFTALNANMYAAIDMMRITVDGMNERGFGRIINITSAAVKSPVSFLGLSNGARAGLTGFVAGLARQQSYNNVTINNLLPGPFATDRIKQLIDLEAQSQSASYEDRIAAWSKQNPVGRLGNPEEFGKACAFLCSEHAGFIHGQNILLDGGAFPGTM